MGFRLPYPADFAVSGYDWGTAFLVSATLGLDDGFPLVFGSLLAGHLLTELLVVLVFGLIAVVRRLPAEHRLRRAAAAAMTRVGLITGAAVLLVAAFVSTPWVPHEVIQTTDCRIGGYVLSVYFRLSQRAHRRG